MRCSICAVLVCVLMLIERICVEICAYCLNRLVLQLVWFVCSERVVFCGLLLFVELELCDSGVMRSGRVLRSGQQRAVCMSCGVSSVIMCFCVHALFAVSVNVNECAHNFDVQIGVRWRVECGRRALRCWILLRRLSVVDLSGSVWFRSVLSCGQQRSDSVSVGSVLSE